jgi:hypothetical protein
MSESHLQHRGTHYRFRFLRTLAQNARCILCHRALVDGCYDDAFCERCGVPLHFSCHQRVAASPAERAALQAMVDELNAPCPMVEVEIGSPEGPHFTVSVRRDSCPADETWLIVLCPGCRS